MNPFMYECKFHYSTWYALQQTDALEYPWSVSWWGRWKEGIVDNKEKWVVHAQVRTNGENERCNECRRHQCGDVRRLYTVRKKDCLRDGDQMRESMRQWECGRGKQIACKENEWASGCSVPDECLYVMRSRKKTQGTDVENGRIISDRDK